MGNSGWRSRRSVWLALTLSACTAGGAGSSGQAAPADELSARAKANTAAPERAEDPSVADAPKPGAAATQARTKTTPALCDEDAPWPFDYEDTGEQFDRELPTRDVEFGSVRCKAEREVWRDSKQRIRVCTVARPVTVHGIDIAADAYTHFHGDGRPEQTSIAHPQILATAAGEAILCAAGHVSLSKTGALAGCSLEQTTTIATIPCRAGEHVAFHPGGQLWRATVDLPHQALGVTFAAGTRLSWHEDGGLAGGWVPDPLTLLGFSIQFEFTVHTTGSMAQFDLASARDIDGHGFPEWAKIRLRPNGRLRSAEYVSDRGFMPHGEQWTDTVYLNFDCEGSQASAREEHWQAPTR